MSNWSLPLGLMVVGIVASLAWLMWPERPKRSERVKPIPPQYRSFLRVSLVGGQWDSDDYTELDWWRAKATRCGALHIYRYHPMGAVIVRGFAPGTWIGWTTITEEIRSGWIGPEH